MYRYKKNSNIDAYGETENVIHFKFGDCRKAYNFTKDFQDKYPNFVKEYLNYFMNQESLFSDPLAIVNYIEMFDLPIRLYSNYTDQEFADPQAVKEWLANEYQGQNSNKLFQYTENGYVGLDKEVKK